MQQAQFLMVFPAYAINDRDHNDFHYIAKTGESTASIVILTDDDLVDRYLADHELNGVGHPIFSAPELALFLDSLPRHVTRIVIDPGTKNVFTGSIVDFQHKILAGLPGNN